MTNFEHNVTIYTNIFIRDIYSFKHCVDLYKCDILKTIKRNLGVYGKCTYQKFTGTIS